MLRIVGVDGQVRHDGEAHAHADHRLHGGVVVGAERVVGFDLRAPEVLVDVALAGVVVDLPDELAVSEILAVDRRRSIPLPGR